MNQEVMRVGNVISTNELAGVPEQEQENLTRMDKIRNGLKTVGKVALKALDVAGTVAGLVSEFEGASSLALGLVMGARALIQSGNKEKAMGE